MRNALDQSPAQQKLVIGTWLHRFWAQNLWIFAESLSRDAIFARIFAWLLNHTIKNRFHHADQGRKRPSNNMEHQGMSDRHVLAPLNAGEQALLLQKDLV